MAKADLRIDWATHEAAEYACKNWHYSKCIPVGKLVKCGVWEGGKFVGVVLFGRGANAWLGKPYGCDQTNSCELVRVALAKHDAPVSRILAVALKWLKKSNPKMRLVVSFADTEQGHHGGVYQATNWIYSGITGPDIVYLYGGKIWHKRSFYSHYGSVSKYYDKGLKAVSASRKHRYLMPMDDEMRRKLLPLSRPYPKRAKQAMASFPEEQRQGSTDPHAPINKAQEAGNVPSSA